MDDIARMLNFSQEILAMLHWDGEFQVVNTTFQKLFDIDDIQAKNLTLLDIFAPQEYPFVLDALHILRRGHPVIERVNYVKSGERTFPVKWSAYPDSEYGKIYFVGDFKDLQVGEEQKLRLAIDIAPVAMAVVDGKDGLINMTNNLCLDMFGYKSEEIVGQPVEKLMPPQYRDRHQGNRRSYLEVPRMRPMGTGHLFYGYRKNGEIFALDIGLNPLHTEKGILVVCSLLDITHHETLNKKMLYQIQTLRAEIANLESLAAEDELTKIPNRRTLMKQLQLFIYEAYGSNSPLVVAMIDIDKFKEINDRYGHLTGDTVLRQFANEVRKKLRSKDILARYGGDEFVVMLPNTTNEQAFNILERLRSHLESCPWEIPVRASIGYSMYYPNKKEVPNEMLVTELLLEADIALYQAKQSGRNKVVSYGSELASA